MRGIQTDFLTTRELARMWQVSQATIKRWADAGHLRTTKTLGGHRRFAVSEVARFQYERGLLAPTAAAEGQAAIATPHAPRLAQTSAPEASADAFFKAIVGGLESVAAATLLKIHLGGAPLVSLLEGTVASAMHRVGDLWEEGKLSVADEHLATRAAVCALESFKDLIPREQAGEDRRAITCAVEDELHEVGALCAEVLLESEGWKVLNLGANTPFFALSDAVEKYKPELVCISSTTNLSRDRNAREYAQFQTLARSSQARIVLGGEGFRPHSIRRRFPADLYADNFLQLLDFLQKQG